MATSQDFVNWVCTNAIDYRFLKYVLLAEKDALLQYASGTTHQTIYFPEVKAFHICLPPPEEQARLVEVLSALDDKIELNLSMANTLEAMARALFKSCFVDFDPIHARAVGRNLGLPADLSALFPSRFSKDGLPEGWQIGTLGNLADLNPESRGSVTRQDEIAYVDLAKTKWGVIEDIQHFAPGDAPSRAQRVLKAGDTIVGTVRPGNGSYALIFTNGLIGSTGFAVLRPKEPYLREFVYLAATSSESIETLANLADGAAYPAVRPSLVADTACCLAPKKLLKSFHIVCSSLIDRIEAARSEVATLRSLRDTLIPKLISGELRITDAEDRIAAA